jgi:diguanylate cyclase (GGDEF)-like protein
MATYKTYRFRLDSSTDVDHVISQIETIRGENLLVHVASFIHNRVMIHNVIRELEKRYEGVQIVTVKTERDDPTEVVVYAYGNDLMHEQEAMLESVMLYHEGRKAEQLAHDLKETKTQMIQRYFVDSLTNLPNLYKLRHDLEEQSECTFIVFNIDNFKMINDFYGFVIGDYVLEQFAKSIESLMDGLVVYRMSGDEFAVLVDESMDFYRLKSYMTQVADAFRNLSYNYHQTQIYIDVTLASSASQNRDDIFSKVGMALKYAKEMRLPFWIYEDRMHFEREYETNLKTAVKIRKAIEHSGITPYFQPIVSNTTGKIEKFECLSRLIDENGTIHAPDRFIDIAKKIKVYDQVTQTIIEKSFATFAENEYDFSINLSIEDVMSHEMYSFIIDKLKSSNMGKRVIFELLESEAVEDYKKVSRFITEVKRFGARVAIDDFGSGYSNFSYLTKIDVDYIKIDGSLIADIDTNDNSLAITETIVAFAKKMKIKTIAEFVHSSTVMAQVKNIGIDYSQGYHIDEPHPDLRFDS